MGIPRCAPLLVLSHLNPLTLGFKWVLGALPPMTPISGGYYQPAKLPLVTGGREAPGGSHLWISLHIFSFPGRYCAGKEGGA